MVARSSNRGTIVTRHPVRAGFVFIVCALALALSLVFALSGGTATGSPGHVSGGGGGLVSRPMP